MQFNSKLVSLIVLSTAVIAPPPPGALVEAAEGAIHGLENGLLSTAPRLNQVPHTFVPEDTALRNVEVSVRPVTGAALNAPVLENAETAGAVAADASAAVSAKVSNPTEKLFEGTRSNQVRHSFNMMNKQAVPQGEVKVEEVVEDAPALVTDRDAEKAGKRWIPKWFTRKNKQPATDLSADEVKAREMTRKGRLMTGALVAGTAATTAGIAIPVAFEIGKKKGRNEGPVNVIQAANPDAGVVSAPTQ